MLDHVQQPNVAIKLARASFVQAEPYGRDRASTRFRGERRKIAFRPLAVWGAESARLTRGHVLGHVLVPPIKLARAFCVMSSQQ